MSDSRMKKGIQDGALGAGFREAAHRKIVQRHSNLVGDAHAAVRLDKQSLRIGAFIGFQGKDADILEFFREEFLIGDFDQLVEVEGDDRPSGTEELCQ